MAKHNVNGLYKCEIVPVSLHKDGKYQRPYIRCYESEKIK